MSVSYLQLEKANEFVPCTSGFVCWCSRNSCELGLVDFQPHLYFHPGGLCAPQRKPVLLPTSDEKHRNYLWASHSSLFKRLGSCSGFLGFFSQKLILWASWVPVPLQGLMKHQLTVKLLVSFLWQNMGAAPFILRLSLCACLVSGEVCLWFW